MLNRILTHLDHLVAGDTQNPPRLITPDHPAISYCKKILMNCHCKLSITDLGDGCITMLATRGHARTIVNCHLDSVPADPSWENDPLKLTVDTDRATGLGACDIKGAAACMLAAAETTAGSLALLFTTDEEAGQSRCVREFLKQNSQYHRAVVAEPTEGQAVTKHRGLATYEVVFHGTAGHSSVMGINNENAVHMVTQWCADAIALSQQPPYDDIRLNIGLIEGGSKANVSASSARVVFGLRPPSGMHPDIPAHALESLLNDANVYTWKTRFSAPGLDESTGTTELLIDYHLIQGDPVDFWTEAALFNEAGLATVVLGPGNIKQAHTAGEFVLLDDLKEVSEMYQTIFSDPMDAGSRMVMIENATGVH